jgi:thymidylate synthase
MKFKNANEAYEYFHDQIILEGVDFDNTKALFNIGFTLENPIDNIITNKERKFNIEYAKAEWKWYLSGDRSINKLGEIYGKIPPIWKRMADSKGDVNSNYGYQWERNNQLDKVVAILIENPNTRRATISIYDGKEINDYNRDTPCTYAVQFTILDNKLNMSVYMRSNDLWYGFCIDQYCFSMLQQHVAERLSIDVGSYYHHAHNLHLYNDKINVK